MATTDAIPTAASGSPGPARPSCPRRPAPTGPGAADLGQAREEVIAAVLYAAYTERACGGRVTAHESASLDHSLDQLEEALARYVQAAVGASGTPPR